MSSITTQKCPFGLCKEFKFIQRWKEVLFFDDKILTLMVLMTSNVPGMTRGCYLRCSLHGTVKRHHHDLGLMILPSMEQWSFRSSRGVKRQLATWRCCSGRPSWLRALISVLMIGFSTGQCSSSLWPLDKGLLSGEYRHSFGPFCVFPWSESNWKHMGMDDKGSLQKRASVPDSGCPLWSHRHHLA